ncbi:MAG TPA: MotA/TolQ/ExbB proton channel family protein [Kiritimatiellia bacterium]
MTALFPVLAEFPLGEAFRAGGWLLYAITALAIGGLSLVLYLMMLLRREQIVPENLEADVKDLIRMGRLPEARDRCAAHASSLAAICEVALDYVLRAERPHALLLRELVESEHQRQVAMIQGRAQYLLDVSTGALLIGLFCAATGLVRLFGELGMDVLKASPEVIAGGIAQTAVAAAFGLIVALAGMASYAYLRHRLPKLIAHLENAGSEIVRQVGRAQT